MRDFFVKIILAIIVMVIFCYSITNKGGIPTFKSEYDDIHLSENIYDAAHKNTEDALDAIGNAVENDEELVSEKLYTSVPEFFSSLFSTLSEGIGSWKEESVDVEGVKEDSSSLFKKLFEIFPYTD